MRITLVSQGALGDTLLLVPLTKSLRKRFGARARITLVTRPDFGQLLTLLGYLDAWAAADDREHSLWFSEPEGKTPNSWPIWVDCDLLLSAVSNGVDAWAANAKLAIPTGASVMYFNPRPPRDFAGHVTQFHRQQPQELGLPEPELPPLTTNSDGPILIHPGSGGEAKCWPREKFVQLGRDLRRNGLEPTMILGEAEEERWGTAEIDAIKGEFPCYMHMGLCELAEKLSPARLYIGNDSGATHLAATLGLPVIALFGPSDDRQWHPVGPSVQILRADEPHQQSLEHLEVESVLAAVLAELQRVGPQ